MTDSARGSQRPTLLHEPPACDDWTISDLAIEFAASVGYVLDDWQSWLVRWAFVRRADGLWSARDYCIEVPRQNGKNIVLEVIEIVALFALDEDLVIHSAHRTDVSHEHFLSLKAHIEETPDLMAQMPNRPNNGFITANGKESIELANGNRLLFKSRQSGSGRGPRPKRLVFDEALILSTSAVGDMAPGMTAQRNPQIAFASSPPKEDSAMLHDLRRRATVDDPTDRLFYAAWNNPPETDPDDIAALERVNPSLGYGRMTLESLRANRKLMSFADYLREHVGIGEIPPEDGDGAIDPERWVRDLVDRDSLPIEATVRLALDAPPDRKSATFAIAGRREDGLSHVSVRTNVPAHDREDLRPLKVRVIEAAKALTEGHKVDLILPPGSPARAWKAELVAADVPLDELSTPEYAEACGGLVSEAQDGTIRHRGQPEMNNAVDGVVMRASGDVDVFSRRSSSVNIAPLVAAACALSRVPVAQSVFTGNPFSSLDDWEDDE